ncbi:MAG: hypothetical protein CFE24_14680 [Flavobacterium sp. BFFFF2]|nr:MAG: hypothetical protein CFE24_14680 [Flavobacterium sp. BFFFF2]
MIENNFLVSVETVKGLSRFSDNTQKIGNYKGQKRSITNGVDTLSLIFKDNNELEYSKNGIGNTGKWNLEASNTLILEIVGERLWFKPKYLTNALLILYSEIDHKNYCFVSEGYDIKSIEQYYKEQIQGAEGPTMSKKNHKKGNLSVTFWILTSILILVLIMLIYDFIK